MIFYHVMETVAFHCPPVPNLELTLVGNEEIRVSVRNNDSIEVNDITTDLVSKSHNCTNSPLAETIKSCHHWNNEQHYQTVPIPTMLSRLLLSVRGWRPRDIRMVLMISCLANRVTNLSIKMWGWNMSLSQIRLNVSGSNKSAGLDK